MIKSLHRFLDWTLGLEKKGKNEYRANFITAAFRSATFMAVVSFFLGVLLNFFVFQNFFFVHLLVASSVVVVVGIFWGSITGFLVYTKILEPPTIILGPFRP